MLKIMLFMFKLLFPLSSQYHLMQLHPFNCKAKNNLFPNPHPIHWSIQLPSFCIYIESVHSGVLCPHTTAGPMIHPHWDYGKTYWPTSSSALVTPQSVLSIALRAMLKRPDHFSSLLKPFKLWLSPSDLTMPCSDLRGPRG